MLLDFSQQCIPRWHILHSWICYASKMVNVPWAPTQDGKLGGGGGGSRENLAIITKDFEKLYCFAKKWGPCPVFISFLHQTHFTLSCLYFAVDQYFRLYFRISKRRCARRARDERQTCNYVAVACPFLFCFPN